MGRFLIITLTLCLPLLLNAQINYPFPTDSAEWGVVTVETTPTEEVHRLSLFSFYGDTTINGIAYKKLQEIRENSPANYAGALRVNSTGRVYYYNRYANKEKPLYDFNLNVGDTFRTFNGVSEHNLIILRVIETDSVLIGGSYRKRIKLSSSGNSHRRPCVD